MLVLSLKLKKNQEVPCSGSTMNRTPMPRGKPSSINVHSVPTLATSIRVFDTSIRNGSFCSHSSLPLGPSTLSPPSILRLHSSFSTKQSHFSWLRLRVQVSHMDKLHRIASFEFEAAFLQIDRRHSQTT